MRVRHMLATLGAISASYTSTFSAAADKPLPLDFLEYLGTMVEHEGDLLDPMDMEAEDLLDDASVAQTGSEPLNPDDTPGNSTPKDTTPENRVFKNKGELLP